MHDLYPKIRDCQQDQDRCQRELSRPFLIFTNDQQYTRYIGDFQQNVFDNISYECLKIIINHIFFKCTNCGLLSTSSFYNNMFHNSELYCQHSTGNGARPRGKVAAKNYTSSALQKVSDRCQQTCARVVPYVSVGLIIFQLCRVVSVSNQCSAVCTMHVVRACCWSYAVIVLGGRLDVATMQLCHD